MIKALQLATAINDAEDKLVHIQRRLTSVVRLTGDAQRNGDAQEYQKYLSEQARLRDLFDKTEARRVALRHELSQMGYDYDTMFEVKHD